MHADSPGELVRTQLARSALLLTLAVGGVVVSPSVTAGAAETSSLVGSLDGSSVVGSDFRLSGWAFDAADPAAPVEIRIVDGNARKAVAVEVVRNDINRPYAITGAHGFTWSTPVPSGDRRFCITASTATSSTSLGCVDVGAVSHQPVGHLDKTMAERLVSPTFVSQRVGNAFVATGWAYDPDDPSSPVTIRLRDTAPDGTVRDSERVVAGKRPDVAAAVFGAPEISGFSATIALTSVVGTHRVCMTVVNVGAGSDVPLGCADGIVRSKRTGAIEALEQPERGRVSVDGWVSGFGDNDLGPAGLVRLIGPDGALEGGTVGGTRGGPGRWTIDFDPQIYFGGPYTACLGQEIPGATEFFDCRQFESPAMLGGIERLSVANGVLTATGWAIDPLRPDQALGVAGMEPPTGGSGFIASVVADQPRPDIGAAYGLGDNHGFTWTLDLASWPEDGAWCLHGDSFLPFETTQCFTLDGQRADDPRVYLRQGSKFCSIPRSKEAYYLGYRFSRFIDPRVLGYSGGPSCGWNSLPEASLVQYAGSADISLGYVRDGASVYRRLTLDDWIGMGTPTPRRIPVAFAGLSWAPPGLATVRTTTSGASVSTALGYDQWRNAGLPTPQQRSTLPGDAVCSAPGVSDLVYRGATFAGVLRFDQWAASGFLAPSCDWRSFPEAKIRATPGTPTLVFTYRSGSATASHTLTYPEWEQMGFPQPV
jgi:hypothetical protein